MTRERALQILRDAGCYVAHGEWTDARGASHLTGIAERTLREWRAKGIGPEWGFTTRCIYPIDGLLAFMFEKNTGARRRKAAVGGE